MVDRRPQRHGHRALLGREEAPPAPRQLGGAAGVGHRGPRRHLRLPGLQPRGRARAHGRVEVHLHARVAHPGRQELRRRRPRPGGHQREAARVAPLRLDVAPTCAGTSSPSSASTPATSRCCVFIGRWPSLLGAGGAGGVGAVPVGLAGQRRPQRPPPVDHARRRPVRGRRSRCSPSASSPTSSRPTGSCRSGRSSGCGASSSSSAYPRPLRPRPPGAGRRVGERAREAGHPVEPRGRGGGLGRVAPRAARAAAPWLPPPSASPRCRTLLRPDPAYAQVCGCSGSSCSCGSLCCDGYTEFCCTLTGANSCPPGAVLGGWWKVEGHSAAAGSARYYMDCHRTCGSCGCGSSGLCTGGCANTSCGCANGSCGNRKAGCTRFRYGNCASNHACLGPDRVPGGHLPGAVDARRHLHHHAAGRQQHPVPRPPVPGGHRRSSRSPATGTATAATASACSGTPPAAGSSRQTTSAAARPRSASASAAPATSRWSATGTATASTASACSGPARASWLLRDTPAAGGVNRRFGFGGRRRHPGRRRLGRRRHATASASTGRRPASGSSATPPAAAASTIRFGFGGPGDIPVVGDWDGDGRDGIGVFRPRRASGSCATRRRAAAWSAASASAAPATCRWSATGTASAAPASACSVTGTPGGCSARPPAAAASAPSSSSAPGTTDGAQRRPGRRSAAAPGPPRRPELQRRRPWSQRCVEHLEAPRLAGRPARDRGGRQRLAPTARDRLLVAARPGSGWSASPATSGSRPTTWRCATSTASTSSASSTTTPSSSPDYLDALVDGARGRRRARRRLPEDRARRPLRRPRPSTPATVAPCPATRATSVCRVSGVEVDGVDVLARRRVRRGRLGHRRPGAARSAVPLDRRPRRGARAGRPTGEPTPGSGSAGGAAGPSKVVLDAGGGGDDGRGRARRRPGSTCPRRRSRSTSSTTSARVLVEGGWGGDRGFLEPDARPVRRAPGGVRLVRRRRAASAPTTCATSGSSTSGSSCTTRTPTCRGGAAAAGWRYRYVPTRAAPRARRDQRRGLGHVPALRRAQPARACWPRTPRAARRPGAVGVPAVHGVLRPARRRRARLLRGRRPAPRARASRLRSFGALPRLLPRRSRRRADASVAASAVARRVPSWAGPVKTR